MSVPKDQDCFFCSVPFLSSGLGQGADRVLPLVQAPCTGFEQQHHQRAPLDLRGHTTLLCSENPKKAGQTGLRTLSVWRWFPQLAVVGKRGLVMWGESMRQPRPRIAQVDNSIPSAARPQGKEVVWSGMSEDTCSFGRGQCNSAPAVITGRGGGSAWPGW